MIQIIDLCKAFQTKDVETQALDHINLEIKDGEFVSIMGPSGCGKSTLLNAIGLLDQPTSGKILIDDTDISQLNDRKAAEFRNKTLGFVFQNFHLIPSLNVTDNVELPLLFGNVPADERKERVKTVLEEVGLSHRMKHFPSQLSGGQCQRVAIARAIVSKPQIILADEPTGNLDSKMGKEIMDLLLDLNKQGVTIVMVTHDESIALQTSRIIRLLDGKLL
ncbi:ABC transporter ATP-binding protein [Bacteroides bouchesdurhonensis]|uniref:ABC transporter ATP-binding protein n=1 Tax=Bacteroides bouchesdurhonensis TaxID=1841855 RepID=UPI0011DD91A6|nr:ABC transporter ATP-binding protein [Bacteroides bouchesdurhonensis]